MPKFLLIFIINIPLFCFSQSGYLGSKFNITAKVNSTPLIYSFRGKFIKNQTAYQYGNRNLNLSYQIGISRVISDEIEIGIAFKVVPLQFFGYYNSSIGLVLKNAFHNSVIFKYRKIMEGISPIGKKWGINVELGYADITSVTALTAQLETNPERIGLLNYRHNIIENTLNKQTSTSSLPYTANTLIIKYYRGMTFPIHKKLALDASFTVSLLRVFQIKNKTFTGFQLFNSDLGINELGEEFMDAFTTTYWSKQNPLAYSILKYNDFSFNLGLRYFL